MSIGKTTQDKINRLLGGEIGVGSFQIASRG
jgi:hypothetical protein